MVSGSGAGDEGVCQSECEWIHIWRCKCVSVRECVRAGAFCSHSVSHLLNAVVVVTVVTMVFYSSFSSSQQPFAIYNAYKMLRAEWRCRARMRAKYSLYGAREFLRVYECWISKLKSRTQHFFYLVKLHRTYVFITAYVYYCIIRCIRNMHSHD